MHIILSSNGTPFAGARGGYPSQLKHLIQMFLEGGHTVTVLMWAICGIKHTGVIFFKDIVKHNILQNENKDPHSQALLDRPEVSFILSPYDTFPVEIEISQINRMISETGANAIFFLQDIFVLKSSTPEEISVPSFLWFPLHYDPIDRPTVMALNKIKHIISLCPSTKYRVSKQMNRDSYMVPHIIDFMTPISVSKDKIRKEFRLEGYVVGTVAGNYEHSGRKSLDTTLIAFKEFHDKHPNSLLWIHAPTLNQTKIYDIQEMVETLDMVNCVKITENTLDETTLQKFYISLDCYLCGSCSEGFGIPQLEAQYFGKPVVTTDFGAMGDFCLHGVKVPYAFRKYNQHQHAWWVQPSPSNLAKGLMMVYEGDLDTEDASTEIKNMLSYDNIKKSIMDILEKK